MDENGRKSFYVHFFLVAQKMLPRHQLREFCRMAKKGRSKMLDDNEQLTAQELALLMKPLLDEMMTTRGYSAEKANEILKEAARRAGLNPDDWNVTTEELKPS